MRWSFKDSLHDMMKRDDRAFLLWADVGSGLFKNIIADFPNRTLNCGVMEQSTISMAAGMAIAGMRPIVYSILPFLLERAFEQIKIDVDQMKLPVGIVGHSDASCGPTHQELDAGALCRLFRHIKGYQPKSIVGMQIAMQTMNLDQPWILKLSTVKGGK